MTLVKYLTIAVCAALLSAGAAFAADGTGGAFAGAARYLVFIDPGHQSSPDRTPEADAPGSSQLKPRVSRGTRGVSTGKWEYELNLENALLLERLLTGEGFNVMLARRENDVRVSNAERAVMANLRSADVTVRLHADSMSGDPSRSGATILVPARSRCGGIYEASRSCGAAIEAALVRAGIKTAGIVERADLTGFNWSQVPVVLIECGFMSNPEEDRLLSAPSYRLRQMRAVAEGVKSFLSNR